jgi:hypothetical protein
MVDVLSQYAAAMNISVPLLIMIIIAGVWDGVWKLIAMWKAAGKKQLSWFIILGIVNTVGILSILYVYIFSKIDLNQKNKAVPKKETKSKPAKKKSKKK